MHIKKILAAAAAAAVLCAGGCARERDTDTVGFDTAQIKQSLYPDIPGLKYESQDTMRYTSGEGYSIYFPVSLAGACYVRQQAVEGSGKLREVFHIDDTDSGANIIFYSAENDRTAEEMKELCSDMTSMKSTMERLGYDSTAITGYSLTRINNIDALVMDAVYEQSGGRYSGRLIEYIINRRCYYGVMTLTDKTAPETEEVFGTVLESLELR